MDDVTNPETEVTEAPAVEDDFAEFEQQADAEESGEAEDAATGTDETDTPEEGPEEAQTDSDDLEDIEIDGKAYRVPKDAALRQADYTRKTQALAERSREVDATLERLSGASEVETQALANVAMVAAKIAQYDNIDWDAWRASDPDAATNARLDLAELHRERDQAINGYNDARSNSQALVQQETARRLAQAESYAKANIPEWNADKARAILDFGQQAYDLTMDDLRGAIAEKPAVLKLLSDAMEGQKVKKQATVKKKIEAAQAIKPVTTLKGNAGQVRPRADTNDFLAFEKLADQKIKNRRR